MGKKILLDKISRICFLLCNVGMRKIPNGVNIFDLYSKKSKKGSTSWITSVCANFSKTSQKSAVEAFYFFFGTFASLQNLLSYNLSPFHLQKTASVRKRTLRATWALLLLLLTLGAAAVRESWLFVNRRC